MGVYYVYYNGTCCLRSDFSVSRIQRSGSDESEQQIPRFRHQQKEIRAIKFIVLSVFDSRRFAVGLLHLPVMLLIV